MKTEAINSNKELSKSNNNQSSQKTDLTAEVKDQRIISKAEPIPINEKSELEEEIPSEVEEESDDNKTPDIQNKI